MDALVLRFDAPLMAFGGTAVDQKNPTDRFPGRSLVAGLMANALGWDHGDYEKLARLEERLRVAARWDAEPQLLVDYQTVDLGQEFLMDTGWTTRGYREDRAGASGDTTHQRWREYWANGVCTVVVTLTGEEEPTLEQVASAFYAPARPLFLGRKCCLPGAPLLVARRQGATLREILWREPLAGIGPRVVPRISVGCWPASPEDPEATVVYDRRDWRNNIHRGFSWYRYGALGERL